MFKLEDRGHVTYDFNPGNCVLPVPEGTEVELTWIGHYSDDEVACDILQVTLPDGKVITTQPNGTVLHSTYDCIEGVSPVQSGLRATTNGVYFINKVGYPYGKAIACYFKAKERI